MATPVHGEGVTGANRFRHRRFSTVMTVFDRLSAVAVVENIFVNQANGPSHDSSKPDDRFKR
jgi:hypothetical protein